MKKLLLLSIGLIGLIFPAKAQIPTWADDVACIFYSNCTSCHNPNGAAPFSMITYQDVYPPRFSIKARSLSGEMPPWPPNMNYQRHTNERYLTDDEKAIIAAWVDGGAPQGNPANAPVPPTYTSSSQLQQIDFSGRMPVYTNTATLDDYRCFIIELGNQNTEHITAVEVVPGNSSMVHHVLVFADEDSAVYYNLDAADPGPGYTNFGGAGTSTAKLVSAWVPGSSPYILPTGMGMKINPRSRIILQMHYPIGFTGDTDSTRINLTYSSGGPIREVYLDPILNHVTNINTPLVIQPNEIKTFTETYSVPISGTILAVAPHMHLIGRTIKAYVIKPNNDTIPLIDIPNWNFMWQGQYVFRQPIKIPAGSVLKAEATYDNTSNNPYNPNFPPQLVTAGESTTDEMMLIYFSYLFYQNGDENIIIDTATTKKNYLDCHPSINIGLNEEGKNMHMAVFPNPGKENLQIEISPEKPGDIIIEIMDITGKLLSRQLFADRPPGLQIIPLQTHGLTNGMYLARVHAGTSQSLLRFMIQD